MVVIKVLKLTSIFRFGRLNVSPINLKEKNEAKVMCLSINIFYVFTYDTF